MSTPQYSPYKDALTNAMTELAKLEDTILTTYCTLINEYNINNRVNTSTGATLTFTAADLTEACVKIRLNLYKLHHDGLNYFNPIYGETEMHPFYFRCRKECKERTLATSTELTNRKTLLTNVTFGNRNIGNSGWGFNTTWRYQDQFVWQSSIVNQVVNQTQQSLIPAFHTLDAQVSKKLSAMKTILKVGGSNLLGAAYTTGWANPTVGSIYYVSLTFDQLLNK